MRPAAVKVLVADSAPVYRTRLLQLLTRHAGVAPLAGAADVAAARQAVIDCQPDIIILDLDLPGDSALPFLRKLREHYPVPTFVTCQRDRRQAPAALRAIELGALDLLVKPIPGDRAGLEQLAEHLAQRAIEATAHARPVPPPRVIRRKSYSWTDADLDPSQWLVAIGASTGGTQAIQTLLASAPPDFPPVVITQHMPAGFTASFAERLNDTSPLTVTEAAGGERLHPGMALVARGDTHLEVRRRGGYWIAGYTHQSLVNNHCPSVDVMFHAVAQHAGRAAIGVLLTGMGSDGAAGLLAIRQRGGLTFAQEQRSCVVYGMPKAAAELDAALGFGTPPHLPQQILQHAQQRVPARA